MFQFAVPSTRTTLEDAFGLFMIGSTILTGIILFAFVGEVEIAHLAVNAVLAAGAFALAMSHGPAMTALFDAPMPLADRNPLPA